MAPTVNTNAKGYRDSLVSWSSESGRSTSVELEMQETMQAYDSLGECPGFRSQGMWECLVGIYIYAWLEEIMLTKANAKQIEARMELRMDEMEKRFEYRIDVMFCINMIGLLALSLLKRSKP